MNNLVILVVVVLLRKKNSLRIKPLMIESERVGEAIGTTPNEFEELEYVFPGEVGTYSGEAEIKSGKLEEKASSIPEVRCLGTSLDLLLLLWKARIPVEDAQTRFETTSKQSNNLPLSRGYTLGSGEDSMKLLELMELCTKLSDLNHNQTFHSSSNGEIGISRQAQLCVAILTNSERVKEQFWQTASASTPENEEMEITATIDGKVKVVSEASIRRHLKLEDSDGIITLPIAVIFEQLALLWGKGLIILVESHHTPTSAPSTSQLPTSSPSMQTNHVAPMPHDSPIPRVYSLGSDEGSLTLNELTVLL
ncbi:hypothetical protein Tco_0435363 [Tanacetum coccineum]